MFDFRKGIVFHLNKLKGTLYFRFKRVSLYTPKRTFGALFLLIEYTNTLHLYYNQKLSYMYLFRANQIKYLEIYFPKVWIFFVSSSLSKKQNSCNAPINNA